MKRLLMVLVVLAIVAGMSFAVDVSGSTEMSGIGDGDQQRLEVAQEIDIDLGVFHFDVDGEIDYDLPVKETFWEWEVGTSVMFCPNEMLTIGATAGGDKDVKLGDITAYTNIVFGTVGADVDFLFSADETKDAFQGADFSVYFDIGKLACRIGYLWTENGEPDVNAPELLTNGGFYVKAKISY